VNFTKQLFKIARGQSGFIKRSKKPALYGFETAVNRWQFVNPS